MLKGKKILLGITGSIAAYKSALLTRSFVKAGAEVKIIMSPCAHDFITPLTLSTLSKNPVYTKFISAKDGTWNNHVDLALWADTMIIAPASANTIAKMAAGICDNLLLATYLSSKRLVFIAPAMDLDMYKHTSTQKNISKLISFGNKIINPGNGELASGLYGEGRMAEPEEITEVIGNYFSNKSELNGKTALVTAGPTYEAIDPVRFIGNHSSGKMGFAIAEELANKGAKVILVCGPTDMKTEHSNIKRIDVVNADEMYKKCIKKFKDVDIAVMAAAVADFTLQSPAKNKIKKEEMKNYELELKPTKDILAELGKAKTKKQLLAGFALETNNESENAKKKIKNKNLDFIVLNSLKDKGAGFKTDTNKVSIIDRYNKVTEYGLKAKSEVAKDIIQKIISLLLK